MKLTPAITSVWLLIALIFPNMVEAASRSVAIRNENTYIDSKFRIATLKQILYSTAMTFDYGRLAVSIDGFQREPRGRMQDARISLSPYVARDTEFTKLFVHELAHYIDIYIFFAAKNRADISDGFYAISWKKPTVKRATE